MPGRLLSRSSAPDEGRGAATVPPPPRHSRGYLLAKRAIDLVASALGLLVLVPVMTAVAVAVKSTSPGPVLFRQTRVGRAGRHFTILKFRSMRDRAKGMDITASDDARITRVGRVLRRYKLDELPQLWNVLAGDMSLVGPRPEVERYVKLFEKEYARILTIRPGITDFAALEYRDEESLLASSPDPERTYQEIVLPAKIRLYSRYLDEMSLGTDLLLILRTIGVLLK